MPIRSAVRRWRAFAPPPGSAESPVTRSVDTHKLVEKYVIVLMEPGDFDQDPTSSRAGLMPAKHGTHMEVDALCHTLNPCGWDPGRDLWRALSGAHMMMDAFAILVDDFAILVDAFAILVDDGGRRGRSGCCLLNLAGAAIAVVVGLTCLGYLSIMVAIAVVIGLAVWILLCLCFISHEKHK